jgi:hypothetical protein
VVLLLHSRVRRGKELILRNIHVLYSIVGGCLHLLLVDAPLIGLFYCFWAVAFVGFCFVRVLCYGLLLDLIH